MRVAVDLMGGDGPAGAVVDGVLAALAADPALAVTLVGPPAVAAELLAARGARLPVVAATQVVEMGEDPARAIRAKRDATVRVATRLVRDGAADAAVSVGSTGAALAAGLFTLGRLPGVTRPALAVPLPCPRGPVLLLDAGANPEAAAGLLGQFALAGAAYARVAFGLADPRVGLLSIGTEPGKGDLVRKDAHALLTALPIRFVGNVEGGDVALGGAADVVVTDGFTGNVLLKGMEGAVQTALEALEATFGAGHAAVGLLRRLGADGQGGAVLLGVDGVLVIGHGAAGPAAVAACVRAAAQAVRSGLVPGVRAALAQLVARRRAAAGLV